MADLIEIFNRAADSVRAEYLERRRTMSFGEYLGALAQKPRVHLRDAARYLLDAVDFFGADRLETPWGHQNRYRIFDHDFGQGASRLVGQEAAQAAVRAAIAAQVGDGRVNRMIVIHGPNGSAKSTLVGCLFAGLDHYSRLPEGDLFRFRWVFPTRKSGGGASIGFGGRLHRDHLESFAHLEDDEIDATLECEVRDHPLLILPKEARRELMEAALELAGHGGYQIPDYLLHASLCHRCRQVVDSLMRTHQGDLAKVLAHVQVEPWAMSRRYRRGLVQVGPQLSVDASQRQITADRSLSALPTELQNVTLFETFGALVDGAGGIVEFEDMLKRPLDSFKYLLGTIETGEVLLPQSILKLNSVLLATTNDVMLEAFREHHEYPSFRDRLTLVPVPYITRRSTEARIYDLLLVPQVGRHVAPHAVEAAAHFAVLTRLHKPDPARYPERLQPVIAGLGALQKCDLYEDGTLPPGLGDELEAALSAAIRDLRVEDAGTWQYEGRFGASPRLIRQTLLSAALSEEHACLSPFAVLAELEALCGRVREHPFLDRQTEPGGYHDFRGFVGAVEERILDMTEHEVRAASGLIDEQRHEQLLEQYLTHVKHAIKGEKIDNPATGRAEDPDRRMMESVEDDLGVDPGERAEFRDGIFSRIAAWAIEHPGERHRVGQVLAAHLRRLEDAYYAKHRGRLARLARAALEVLDGEERPATAAAEREAARRMLERLTADAGYCRSCARDALARLVVRRFADEEAN
jgi:predicted Ser/Thr protein kinase